MGVGVVLWACRGQRPGMLLRTLEGTGQSPRTKNHQPKMLAVLRLRNPDLGKWEGVSLAFSPRPRPAPPCPQLQGLDGGL